jgi:hypothetical protein
MAEAKTTETDADPAAFVDAVPDIRRREDARTVIDMMRRVTQLPPRMWGPSIIGFGSYAYCRADGSRHRSLRVGLSPRKADLVIYILPGFDGCGDILSRIGPHRTSKVCLYLKRLDRISLPALEDLVAWSFGRMKALYPED